MWVSTVVFSVVFPGPEFAGECARVPRADRLCAWLSGCVHGCQVVCMVVRLCAWLSGCVHGCQVVCMVVRLCAWLCTVRGVVAGSVQRVCSVGLLSAI